MLERSRAKKVSSVFELRHGAAADAAAARKDLSLGGDEEGSGCECSESLVRRIDGYFASSTAGTQAWEGGSANSGEGAKVDGHGHRTMSKADRSYLRGDVRALLKQEALRSGNKQLTARVITR